MIRYFITIISLIPLDLAMADPVLVNPEDGIVELISDNTTDLNLVDGLAFDQFGNLYAALEISGSEGGLVYINVNDGSVIKLADNISRADQVTFGLNGKAYVTSEVDPLSTTDRLFEITIQYDAQNIPVSAISESITTSEPLTKLEGVHVFSNNSAFGAVGTVVVAEDTSNARIALINPNNGETSLLVTGLSGLNRTEGLVVGDFNGALPLAVYVAETSKNRILQILPDGTFSTFGNSAEFGLTSPDNVEFGPDGFLYVIEERANPRLVRVSANGVFSEFASLDSEGGLAFDPLTGDLYLSQQPLGLIYRIRFSLGLDHTIGLTPNQKAIAEVLDAGFMGNANRPLRMLFYEIKKMDLLNKQKTLSALSQSFLVPILNLGKWTADISREMNQQSSMAIEGKNSVDQQVRFFVGGSINFGNIKTENAETFDVDAYGIVVGARVDLKSDISIGASLNLINFSGNIRENANTFEGTYKGFSVFASYNKAKKGFYIDTSLGYGNTDYNYQRSVSFTSQNISITGEPYTSTNWYSIISGYQFSINNFLFELFVSLQNSKTKIGEYSELTTSVISLKLDESILSSYYASLGTHIDFNLLLNSSSVKIKAKYELIKELSYDTSQNIATFLALPDNPFNIAIDTKKNIYSQVSITAQYDLSNQASLALTVGATLGNPRYARNNINLQYSFHF